MKFKQVQPPSRGSGNPVDPEEIFKRLPKNPGSPNDLWRGQTDALRDWHKNRNQADILISLNTGAGKTLIGILVAQSLFNEGLENVVYVCNTNDLVLQTLREAKKLGIRATARTQGEFSDDAFEQGNAICITNYASLFQPFSVFRKKFPPQAVIFDDAHVAEGELRSSYTVSVDRKKKADLYDQIFRLFLSDIEQAGNDKTFKSMRSGEDDVTIIVPPDAVLTKAEQLTATLMNGGISQGETTYSWNNIKEHVEFCSVIFSPQRLDIAPPFLPSLSIPFLRDQNVRRIYLSATLDIESDFIRAFGRRPSHIIKPNNDAGSGERLILFGGQYKNCKFDQEFVGRISKNNKVVIVVPSYPRAEAWKSVAILPERDKFSEELDKFRASNGGAFLLVARFDGIDLPNDACHMMLLDGRPSGSSLLERLQWESLDMTNLSRARIASRIAQAFGRIIRGRTDYGVFFIADRYVENWLRNARNHALLPKLLQAQILLGADIVKNLEKGTEKEILELIEAVTSRDTDWIRHYADSINTLLEYTEDHQRTGDIEKIMCEAALAEAKFAAGVWSDNIPEARTALEQSVEKIAQSDPKLAGWHNIWIAACYFREGDAESAFTEYRKARSRLANRIPLRRDIELEDNDSEAPETKAFVSANKALVLKRGQIGFDREIENLTGALRPLIDDEKYSATQCEEAVRVLGTCLGFVSTRPDNEGEGGPDVVWEDEFRKFLIGLELKTDKEGNPKASLSKGDVDKGHGYLQWMSDQIPKKYVAGLLYVGPPTMRVDRIGSPSPKMYATDMNTLRALTRRLVGLLTDCRQKSALDRINMLADFALREGLDAPSLFQKLSEQKLTDLKK